MDVASIFDGLKNSFGDAILDTHMLGDIPCVVVDKQQLFALVQELKENPDYGFNFLTDLTAIHYPQAGDKEICCTYLLHNWTQNIRLRIKTYMAATDVQVASITDLYAAANWLEREAYDNFGIRYNNHPDLRRILNMDEMDYHPLLKQYALEDETRTDKNDTFFGR